MSRRTKLALSSVVAITLVASLFGVITVPNELNGYHTNYVDIQGVRHVSFGDPSQDTIPYHGVVTYTLKHANGVVFAVIQNHNTRTVQGLNCLESMVFNGLSPAALTTNGTSSSNDCRSMLYTSSAHFNGFRFIGLINGSGTAIMNGSDTYTLSKIGGAHASTHDGIIPVGLTNQGSPANSTVAGSATIYNQLTITSPVFAFTGDAAAGTTIRGAVLFNATSGTPAMFAENAFTGISLANTDTLTVTWTITVS